MSTLLICRRGHQWEGAASQCPECGEASVSALCTDPVSDRDCLPPPPSEPVPGPQAAIAAASARPGDTAPVEPPATPELPGYEILGTLGRGGMGVCPVDLRDFAWRHLLRLCQRQRQTLTGHTGVVRSVAISPSRERVHDSL